MYIESNISQWLMHHSIHISLFYKEYEFNRIIFAWSTGVKCILHILHITARKWRRWWFPESGVERIFQERYIRWESFWPIENTKIDSNAFISLPFSYNSIFMKKKLKFQTFSRYFLDASTHLYMRVCPSVGPSVCPSFRCSVVPSRVFF